MNPPAVEGPYFEDLTVGQVFAAAPGITLWPALAAAHQAITGNRLALVLDAPLCRAVTGGPQLVSPALAWDVAIGQSTVVTQHVKANLFYRGLAFRRLPRIGDTLRTTTTVDGLAAEPAARGPGADRARGAQDHHGRPGGPAGAGLLALRHAAAARSGPSRPGTRIFSTRSAPRSPQPRWPAWSAAGGWTNSPGRRADPGWPG